MENMGRQKFDDAWREAFEGAEQSPSREVWASLDNKLNLAEGGTMKRRVVFYQRLAAASILFALALGALTTYYFSTQGDETNNLAQAAEADVANSKGNQIIDSKISEAKELNANQDQVASVDINNVIQGKNEEPSALTELPTVDGGKNENVQPDLIQKETGKNKEVTNKTDLTKNVDEAITQLLTIKDIEKRSQVNSELKLSDNASAKYSNLNTATLTTKDLPTAEAKVSGKVKEVTIIRILPAMPASMMADSRKDKKSNESLWASIGASAGNYQPQAGSSYTAQADALTSTPGFALASNTTTNSKAASTGSSYSVGVNLAKKISQRWLVLGGVSYLNQAIGYTSNFASIDQSNKVSAYAADYVAREQNNLSLAITSPYEINSVNQFMSVPVQAGYLIIDRKLGLQINSGVATNIFLQNTLTDKSGQLTKYAEGAGESSPYNSFSWSALMGTELSYKMGSHYRLALVPGLRYSMSPLLKSETNAGNSMIWDVGFRFRYIFK
jgi:hypothetical protein